MKYYISPLKTANLSISRVVKRLKDFRPAEGEQYVVRKKADLSDVERFSTLPVYVGVDGKLKKDKDHHVIIF
jgi:hypothetical protein